jgi:hypothetical protein
MGGGPQMSMAHGGGGCGRLGRGRIGGGGRMIGSSGRRRRICQFGVNRSVKLILLSEGLMYDCV